MLRGHRSIILSEMNFPKLNTGYWLLLGKQYNIRIGSSPCHREPLVLPVIVVTVNHQIIEPRHQGWRPAGDGLHQDVRNALLGNRVIETLPISRKLEQARDGAAGWKALYRQAALCRQNFNHRLCVGALPLQAQRGNLAAVRRKSCE